MKLIRIIFLILLGQVFFQTGEVFAFPTHKCPRVIQLNIQSFDLLNREELAQDLNSIKEQAISMIHQDLRSLGRLEVKYTLQFAGGSKCYYEGHNQVGHYYRGHIHIKKRSGVNTPLFVTKTKSYAVKVELTDFSRKGIISQSSEVSVHHFEKSCPERGCPMSYTHLGTGSIRELY